MSNDYFHIGPDQGGGEERIIGGCHLPRTATPETLSQVFGDVGNAKLISRDQWQPVSLKRYCPEVKDQNGIGACCAFDSVYNVEIARAIAGLPYVELSPGDLYRVVSGGSDSGSLPEDNLKRMMNVGVLTAATCPVLEWRRDKGTNEERARFKILEAYWCPTFDHAASALLQGFTINANVWWYGNDPIDSEGWMRSSGTGGRGGHSICGMGLVSRNGQWGVEIINSWNRRFGREGFAVLPEGRCSEGTKVFQWWATRGVVQESGDFPQPKE